ncbi:DUF2269 family protein [Segeticoccus rhizosphaerae]|jgi:uncharacterized membrane protein|uniref:DUF2269 family protein n=1 Tax=Segeticoccus rhizosphaerae TaxID=1104777 RepID=UPI0010C04E53|nr:MULTISPECIES: DUF2269 family protein [Intrasporangiaceae]
METALNVLHVLTAVFIIGPMAILPMTAMQALRSGHETHVIALARSTAILSWASLLVAVLGFGVLGMSDPKYDLSVTTPWVLISLVLYLLALAVSLLVVAPTLRRAGAHMNTADAATTTRIGYGRVAASSGIVSLLLVAVVVLMVWKP